MKYGNRKILIDGILFDSQLEASRYCELKLLQRYGKITDLELQVPFELIPKFEKMGKIYRPAVYKADFVYYDKEFEKIAVEDTKGFKTELYKLKRKLFEYKYEELTIDEITN